MHLTIRYLHRLSACIVLTFVIAHLTNHLVGLVSQQAHREMLASLRQVYRHPIIEPILLTSFGWQILSGLGLVALGWRKRRGAIEWMQAGSGLALAAFLAIHVSAVLAGRASGLDTDLRFAAAGFHVPSWPYFFTPYYFVAIFAVFVHVGAAAYWLFGRGTAGIIGFAVASLSGVLIASAIVLMMAGHVVPLTIEARYKMPFAP